MEEFFDRIDALKAINSTLKKINNGKPVAIWVEGSSGVGKTTFIEYINEQNNIPFFTFGSDEIYFKCEKGSDGKKYVYISAVIYEMKRMYSSNVERFIQHYFNKAEHISILDACCSILPQIKYLNVVSDLIEKKYNNIIDMQEKIHDQLLDYQLTDFFASLIFDFLMNVYQYQKVVFCIDDVQWLDLYSLKVIEKIIKMSKSPNSSLSLSFFLVSRDYDILSDEEKENYMIIYKQLSAIFPQMETIFLENFDYSTTNELINKTGRTYLIENISIIYKLTKGNPLELKNTLRFSDQKIKILIQKERESLQNNIFSIEHISNVYFSSKISSVILSILSIVKKQLSLKLLFKCVSDYYSVYLNDICLYQEFSETLNYFKSENFITNNFDETSLKLAHDSIWNIILDFLVENGDYSTYAKSIAFSILSTNDINNELLLSMHLLSEVDPNECFKQFKNIFYNKSRYIEPETFEIVALAFCSELSHNCNDIKFVVKVILPKLVAFAHLKTSNRLCHMLFASYKDKLSINEQIIYLINYIKTQIDLSCLNNNEESAIPLFEELVKYPFQNDDIRVQILILGMSAYEHVLDHQKIRNLYDEASNIINKKSNKITISTLSIFYRNKGLCFPHCDLIQDYYKAIGYARTIKDKTSKKFILGSCMNNLGLAYFYKGQIHKAEKAFFFSLRNMECVGYNTARICNNIGCSLYMSHNYRKAYSFFSTAAANQTNGVFMKLCIQTNLALSLFSINKEDEAKKILNNIIDEYDKGEQSTSDTLVYCAAMINRGYIAYKEKDYFLAAKYYQKSLIHTYRYQNEEQTIKRTKMIDISLKLALEPDSNHVPEIDLNDSGNDFYKKPYSLVPFSFYVI